MKKGKVFFGVCALIVALGLASCDTNGELENPNLPSVDVVKYTVTFDSDGGSIVPYQTIETGEKVTRPTDPEKKDYTFDGWYKESSFINLWDFDKDTVNGVITLYAKWVHTVRFDSDGGSAVESQKIEEGKKATRPVSPTKEGYLFMGWYKDSNKTMEFDFNNGVITKDITLYAKWEKEPDSITVFFNSKEGSLVNPITNIESGSKITKPTDPTRTGYRFVGWFKDTEGTLTEVFDFETEVITESITLYAKWEINVFTVTFNSDGGSTVESQEIEYNKKASRPVSPTKEGYLFMGWYKDESHTEEFDFVNSVITKNITLYAKWEKEPDSITVFFNSKDGSAVEPITNIESGSKITRPADPVREGYRFVGWFKDTEGTLTEAFDFETEVITKSITLYAQWEANVYRVTFDSDGGSTVESQEIEYNKKASRPVSPTKEGYLFMGWYKDESHTEEFDFVNSVITNNITLYAKWEKEPDSITVFFNSKDGSAVEPITNIESGSKITRPADPVREGYRFVGWFKDSGGDFRLEFDFETEVITKSITLYAKWEEIQTYSVVYEINGHGVQPDGLTGVTTLPNVLPVLTDEVYVFTGWYLDEDYNKKAQPGMDLTEDVILYAKWDSKEGVILDVAEGHLESAYLEWKPLTGCLDYNVYYRKTTDSDANYKVIDKQLIRQYPNKYRADIVGLPAGSYKVKVVPIFNEDEYGEGTTAVVSVDAHDRSGFAFSANSPYKSGSGAYKDDGSLKDNAIVLYVSAKTAKTVSCMMQVDGKSTQLTGIQAILDAKQKRNTTQPLCIRIVGTVSASDLDYMSSSAEGLQIKGNSSYSELNITIEGIGEDATLKGFGFLLRNCGNVEMRNFALLNFMDDGISMDTENCNIWIHNVDIFYGQKGSASDQVKGDGSIDTKGKSNYVTLSYNHFWDSGKCNLMGMKSETTDCYITYHHNWYDHSDSRHPRIRTVTVHVYNNYFDGNSKYGVGVTMGASAFVENNFFRNCKSPMLISLQGTDALGAKGTFSGESGGVIKAYGNHIEGGNKVIYHTENSTSFDAYLAASRNEKVPSSIKALSGGTTYNNFDTDSNVMYEYQADTAEEAKAKVMKYAGRINGGDFKWVFDNAKEDTNYDVIPELRNAIENYKSSLVRILGEGSSSGGETTEPDTPDKPENPDVPIITGDIVHNFTEKGLTSDFFTFKGSLSSGKGTASYNGLTLTQCLKMESATNVSFTTTKTMTLVIVFGSSDTKKNVKIDGTKKEAESNGVLTIVLEAGNHEITKADTTNIFYIALTES